MLDDEYAELLGDDCPWCEDGEECLGGCGYEEIDDPPMNVIDELGFQKAGLL